MRRASRVLVAVLGSSVLLALTATEARAYVGPGGVISGIGAILALIGTLFAAVFGFIWYPVKRLIRRVKALRGSRRTEDSPPGTAGDK